MRGYGSGCAHAWPSEPYNVPPGSVTKACCQSAPWLPLFDQVPSVHVEPSVVVSTLNSPKLYEVPWVSFMCCRGNG